MAPRPRKFPDQDKPLRKVAPSKRGYVQVYLKAERTSPDRPSPLERLDAYAEKHKCPTRQDAIMHMLNRLEPLPD